MSNFKSGKQDFVCDMRIVIDEEKLNKVFLKIKFFLHEWKDKLNLSTEQVDCYEDDIDLFMEMMNFQVISSFDGQSGEYQRTGHNEIVSKEISFLSQLFVMFAVNLRNESFFKLTFGGDLVDYWIIDSGLIITKKM